MLFECNVMERYKICVGNADKSLYLATLTHKAGMPNVVWYECGAECGAPNHPVQFNQHIRDVVVVTGACYSVHHP